VASTPILRGILVRGIGQRCDGKNWRDEAESSIQNCHGSTIEWCAGTVCTSKMWQYIPSMFFREFPHEKFTRGCLPCFHWPWPKCTLRLGSLAVPYWTEHKPLYSGPKTAALPSFEALTATDQARDAATANTSAVCTLIICERVTLMTLLLMAWRGLHVSSFDSPHRRVIARPVTRLVESAMSAHVQKAASMTCTICSMMDGEYRGCLYVIKNLPFWSTTTRNSQCRFDAVMLRAPMDCSSGCNGIQITPLWTCNNFFPYGIKNEVANWNIRAQIYINIASEPQGPNWYK